MPVTLLQGKRTHAERGFSSTYRAPALDRTAARSWNSFCCDLHLNTSGCEALGLYSNFLHFRHRIRPKCSLVRKLKCSHSEQSENMQSPTVREAKHRHLATAYGKVRYPSLGTWRRFSLLFTIFYGKASIATIAIASFVRYLHAMRQHGARTFPYAAADDAT